MLNDVVSGVLGFGVNTVGATLPLIRQGRLRALAVTSPERVKTLAEVPSIGEFGLAGLNLVGWWGLVAPAGTPQQGLNKLSEALRKALSAEEVKAKMKAMEVEPFAQSPTEFAALIRKETPLWADLVKENNLSSE